jgi:transcriptional regulator with XRE-family HTH domain
MSTAVAEDPRVGALLRHWRQRRRMSQLDLALEAGVSARHLSFLETGRSRPSAQMVLHLADQLEVPLRDRNALLLAAGYAPAYEERPLDSPDMKPIREALQLVLDGHDPHPAFVLDRHMFVVGANRGAQLLLSGAKPELLEPPANAMRLALHPDGVAPRIANLAEWRAHLLERLERQVALSGDPVLTELLEEVSTYPAPRQPDDAAAARFGEPGWRAGGLAAGPPPAHDIFVPIRLHDGQGGELSFFSTISTFGTAIEITASELSIESFFPADEHTAETMRRAVASL